MMDCIFCRVISGELPSHTIFEDDKVIVFMSLENHPLVVPKLHIQDIFELDDEHAAAVMQTAVRVAKATKAATGCDGITLSQANGAAAGQDVFHFHLHVKPRFWNDGVTVAWDMATVADSARQELCRKIRHNL